MTEQSGHPGDNIERVRTVILRQAQLVDRFRHDEWIDGLLADDVVWSLRPGDNLVDYRGKEAVRELMRGAAGEGWHGTHIVQPLIEVTGDQASSETDMFYIMLGSDRTETVDIGGLKYEANDYKIVTVVRYSDSFVRDRSGQWRFASRAPRRLGTTAGT